MNVVRSGPAAGIFLATLALASCGPARDLEPVGTAQEPLFACGDTLHHGGNLWEQDFIQTVGCACGAGFQRSTTSVAHSGAGSCDIVGFTSSDPTDCHVNVHIHNAAWWQWGDCFVTVNKDPRPDSCASRCGGSAPAGCFCDSLCTGFGDCCSDFNAICMSAIELRLQGIVHSTSDGLLHVSVANNGRRGTVQQVVCTTGSHTVGKTVNAFLENGQMIDVTLNGYYGTGNYNCSVAGVTDNGAAETVLDNNTLISFVP